MAEVGVLQRMTDNRKVQFPASESGILAGIGLFPAAMSVKL